jgi:hypothetical protein
VLADLTRSAPAGDFGRAWAWHRLGLWPADGAQSTVAAVALVNRVLTGQAAQAAAALARLADEPAGFERWWHFSSADDLTALADAIGRQAGAAGAAGPAGWSVSIAALPDIDADGSGRLWRRSRIAAAADRVAARPSTLRAVAPATTANGAASVVDGAGVPDPARRKACVLAVLVMAEAEPSLLTMPAADVAAHVASLSRRWTRRSGGRQPLRAASPSPAARRVSDDAGSILDPVRAAAANPATAQPAGKQDPPVLAETRNGVTPRPAEAHAAIDHPPGELPDFPALAPHDVPGTGNDRPAAQQRRDPATVPTQVALSTQIHARTAHGGMLFLLNLAGVLDWPARWTTSALWAARGLRWGLHQLAQRLQPLASDDAAALAFCGLLPDADPPDRGQPPADADEVRVLDGIRAELVAALRRRLPRTSTAESDDALLSRVCRRDARLVADPGWLEVHLSPDDVRTDVRAAGLDLDPGWVPWLGLVIRFRYV